jgi:predicted DNA binding CopG/RHH family protein
MTNQELSQLQQSLNAWKNCDSMKLNYCIERNKEKISQALKPVQKVIGNIEGYDEYSQDMSDLRKEVVKLPVQERQEFVEQKQQAINEKYTQLFERIKEVDGIENEDFVPFKVNYSILPESLSDLNMKILYPFINHDA